ncbi:MAG TPA: hypothetical protein DIU07_13120 [Rhodobacteraceae bacterium]|nr:hypothetical protein [Paracoccaceae bacterium]
MARTQTRSRLWAIAPLAVLVFAAWQTATTLSRTPAFNRSLQVETASGGGRPGSFWTMYDRAEYFFWVARGWSYQTFPSYLPGEDGSTERQAALLDRTHRVRDAAMESLRLRPGHATTWMLVANTELTLGNREAALQAWRISHDFAPNSATRARNRMLFLIRFMSEPENRELALATVSPDTIRAELSAMEKSTMTSALATLLAEEPLIANILADQ